MLWCKSHVHSSLPARANKCQEVISRCAQLRPNKIGIKQWISARQERGHQTTLLYLLRLIATNIFPILKQNACTQCVYSKESSRAKWKDEEKFSLVSLVFVSSTHLVNWSQPFLVRLLYISTQRSQDMDALLVPSWFEQHFSLCSTGWFFCLITWDGLKTKVMLGYGDQRREDLTIEWKMKILQSCQKFYHSSSDGILEHSKAHPLCAAIYTGVAPSFAAWQNNNLMILSLRIHGQP